MTDAVGLGGTFHEVFMQGFRRVLYGLGFTAGIVGGEFAFPFFTVPADAGSLQVVVQQTDGVRTRNDVAQHAAIGAVGVGDEASAGERVAAEYGDGEKAADGVVCGDKGVLPVGKGATQAVCREVFVAAEFLKAEYIDVLLPHVPGYLFAGVAGDFVSEVMNVVGGYGEVTAGVALMVRCRCRGGYVTGGTEPDNGREVLPIEEESYQRDERPFLACHCPAEGDNQAGDQQYRYGKSQQGHDGGAFRMVMSGTGREDGDGGQHECGGCQYQMKQAFDGGFSHGRHR